MPLILGTNSIKDTGYEVANSLRFDDGSGDSLTRSQSSSPSSQRIFTFSAWVKRGNLNSGGSDPNMQFFSQYTNTANRMDLRFQSGDTIDFYHTSSLGRITTNRLFRDTSAWYHVLLRVDTTQATSSDRYRLYINGVQETSFSTATYPSQNADLGTNFSTFSVGDDSYGTAHFDGYFAEVVYCDGQSLDPTSFGEFDEDSPTIWKPKDVSGLTFGTNGFYLDFENASSLGADVSGNSNNFTVNNLTSVDQSTDTCTNNFATMNPLDVSLPSTFALSEGNLDALLNGFSSSGGNTYPRAFSTFQLTSGKWYAECKITEENDSGVIGISARSAISYVNIGGTNFDWLGINAHDYRYYHDGTKMNNNSSSSYGTTWDGGDTIGVALDLDNLAVYFSLNGTFQASGDPTSGSSRTNAAFNLTAVASTPNGAYKIGIGTQGDANQTQGVWNFGSPPYAISSGNSDANGHGNFEYSVPSGYFAICTKNLAEYG
jgi:hypothetical protein